jgi:hypothetical protein
MKLYTEEQVKQIVEKSRETGLTAEYLMLVNTPIELPSDEEIVAQTKDFMFEKNKEVFYNGAKWMKEQILNQNK